MRFATEPGHRASRLKAFGLSLALLLLAAPHAIADPAWILDPANSTLTYQSVKKNTIVETNTIRNISGRIEPDGNAKVQFDLDSVDTGIDLRNVRMRFLFFETYSFPIATATLKLDPAQFADLAKVRRMTVPLTFTLNLHGVDKELKSDAIVTMLTEGSVSVASKAPIAVHVEDFGLLPNIDKLQQAANVSSIVPTASVSYDFVFNAEGSAPASAAASAAPAEPATEAAAANGAMAAPAPASTPQAEPTKGPVTTDAGKAAFTEEECLNRFDVLSKTGAIYFRTASARLDPASKPVLDEVVGVVSKCPKLKVEVSGHTDAVGSDQDNLRLSEKRAGAVADFIRAAGIPATQISSVGYGSTKPVVANDSAEHRALNRRIEFSATAMTN
jgi:outer membrane protein OmpA-like peptidoglycan-associated protein